MSRTKTPERGAPVTRLVASDENVTYRPLPEISQNVDAPLALPPVVDVLTRRVTGADGFVKSTQ